MREFRSQSSKNSLNGNFSNESYGVCYKKINEPLSQYYRDGAKLYLPETGLAYQYAEELKKIPNHQLRKILNEIKVCINMSEDEDFNVVRNKLFVIVPMTAYNTSRMKSSGVKGALSLYSLVKNHINETTIQTMEDIRVLDKLYTSLAAYHTTFK